MKPSLALLGVCAAQICLGSRYVLPVSPKLEEHEEKRSCLRQENFDLVAPPNPKYVLRKLKVRYDEDTTSDVYVVATGITVNSLNAVVELTRKGETSFSFSITGDADIDNYKGVAKAGLRIEGLDFATESTTVDWLASMVANRDRLRGAQDVELYFKLSGVASAVRNETSQDWNVQLMETAAEPFQFQVSDQWLLQKVLTNYGGIDKVLIDVIWPLVKQAVPKMLAILLQHMPPESLEFRTSAKVFGTSNNESLELDMKITSNFNLSPGDAVRQLLLNYNLTDEFDHRMQELMRTSEVRRLQRDALLKTLQLYGFDAGEGLLRDLARGGARSLVAFLQLLLPEHHSGHCIIEGLKMSTGVDVGWSDTDEGKVKMSIGSADDTQEILRVPPELRKLVCSRSFMPPDKGQISNMTIEDLRLVDGTLTLESCVLSDIIFDTGNDSLVAPNENNFFLIGGGLSDLRMSVPAGLRPPMNALCEKVVMSLSPDGVLSLSACHDGLRLDFHAAGDALGDPHGLEKLQDHEPDKPPASFSRPTRPWKRPRLVDTVPFLNSSLGVVVNVLDDRLKFEAHGGAHAKIDMKTILKAFAVDAGVEDDGFVYFTGDFTRIVTNGEAEFSPDVTAILSCGVLRLIKPFANETSRLSIERLNMQPKNGQLQLDLEKYNAAPDIVIRKDTSCLDLYSSGYPARKGWMWYEVQEKLCGSPELVEGLRTAIQLQLDRWKGSGGGVVGGGGSQPYEKEEGLPAKLSFAELHLKEDRSLVQEKGVSPKEAFAEHQLEDDASLLQDPQAVSRDRQMCRAREDLDSKYYPPDTYWGTAVRMSIPGIPKVGDLHLVVGSVQMLKVSMDVTVWRKTDDTFTFILDGPGAAQAEIHAWFEDLQFHLPQSPTMASFGRGFAKFENFFGMLVGLSDYGRIDAGVLSINFAMKSDFKMSGTKWEIVRDTARQDLSIKFGQGGVVQGKINDAIKGAEGVDQLFFDLVWPLLQKVIPQKLGEAFKTVPASEGMIRHTLHIDGSCPLPSADGKRCPSQKFNVEIQDSVILEGSPEPIIRRLRQTTPEWNFTKDVFDNLINAYNQSHVVFDGAELQLSSNIDLDQDKDLHSRTRLYAHLPFPTLTGLVGPNSVLLKLIPDTEELFAAGVAVFQDGLITVPGADLYSLRLPLELPEGADEIAINGDLRWLTIEKLRRRDRCNMGTGPDVAAPCRIAGGDAVDTEVQEMPSEVQEMPSLDIWSKTSALKISAPRFKVSAGRAEGLDALFSRRGELHVDFKKEFMLDVLKKSTEFLNLPLNLRTGNESDADGQVPAEFRRRPAREPAKLRLQEAIGKATADVNLKINVDKARASAADPDFLESGVTLTIHGQLLLDNSFWRGLLDAMDLDFGYVHLSVYGTYKDKQVLARLGCGALDIFDASGTPYENLVESVDLPKYFKSKPNLDYEISLRPPARCFPIRDKHELCVRNNRGGRKLHIALGLQRDRFNGVQKAKATNREHRGENTLGLDATWFRELHPYDPTTFYPGVLPGDDVESPLEAWTRLTTGGEV